MRGARGSGLRVRGSGLGLGLERRDGVRGERLAPGRRALGIVWVLIGVVLAGQLLVDLVESLGERRRQEA